MGKLTPQYSKRKRRGTTPPEDLPTKKSKKWHKIFMSPVDEDVKESHTGNNGSTEGNEGPSSTGKKKLVLLPPNQTGEDRKTCVRCNKDPEYGFLLACMICYRKVYCSVYCKIERNGRSCSALCRPEPDPIAFLNDERTSNYSSSLSSVPDLDSDMGDSSSSSDEERRPVMGGPRQSPELDQGEEVELNKSQIWDIVDFRISKCGRCLIYVLEHVTTRERRSFPADFMIGGDWNARLEVFWLDNKDAWRKRETFESPFGGVKHETGTPFGRLILSARFDKDRYLDFNIRDRERREPDEDGDCTEYQLASLLEAEWDGLIQRYWKHVEIKQDWDRRAKIVKESAAFRDFSSFEPVGGEERMRDIARLTIEQIKWEGL
jgi:hypothetical protein